MHRDAWAGSDVRYPTLSPQYNQVQLVLPLNRGGELRIACFDSTKFHILLADMHGDIGE
jgi:hypothetical protein